MQAEDRSSLIPPHSAGAGGASPPKDRPYIRLHRGRDPLKRGAEARHLHPNRPGEGHSVWARGLETSDPSAPSRMKGSGDTRPFKGIERSKPAETRTRDVFNPHSLPLTQTN